MRIIPLPPFSSFPTNEPLTKRVEKGLELVRLRNLEKSQGGRDLLPSKEVKCEAYVRGVEVKGLAVDTLT